MRGSTTRLLSLEEVEVEWPYTQVHESVPWEVFDTRVTKFSRLERVVLRLKDDDEKAQFVKSGTAGRG